MGKTFCICNVSRSYSNFINQSRLNIYTIYSSALKNWLRKTSGYSRAHVDLVCSARSPLVLRSNSPNHLSIPKFIATFAANPILFIICNFRQRFSFVQFFNHFIMNFKTNIDKKQTSNIITYLGIMPKMSSFSIRKKQKDNYDRKY